MEARALEEELTCAVCLEVHQDPVALPCQHSFCLKCIEDVWTHAIDRDGFSCPQCHRKFNPKPSLEMSFPNVTCDHCIESPSPATKTCLKCETSFCSLHLKLHLTKEIFKDHPLVDPVTDLTHRKCPDHKKILEFFCTDDGVCVCASCVIIGRHKSHTAVSLDQAEASIKEELKSKVENLRRVQQSCSIKQQGLEKSEAEVKTLTNELKGNLLKKFSERSKQLEEVEKYTLELIDEEEHRVISQIRNCSKALKKMMEQIKLIDDEAQNLIQGDCLFFIQDSKQLLSRITETQNVTGPDAPELTLNLSNVSQLLEKRMEQSKKYQSAIVEVIRTYELTKSTGRQRLADPSSPPHTRSSSSNLLLAQTTSNKNCRQTETRTGFSVKAMLAQQKAAASPQYGNQQTNALQRLSRGSKGECSWMTLNPKTASRHLILSNDLRSVMYTYQEQPYPSNPARFKTYSQILCSQSFSSGCHSWDVETDGNWWGIGIAYGSVQKVGRNSDFRMSRKSWCLHLCIGSLSACHNNQCTRLPLNLSIERIRVRLDYDAGTVSFLQVTDTLLTHLHTFNTTFAARVFPAFCCEDKSGLKLLNSF
ncbi:E3 ubiquitin/ISG15 ligase TRIM25-like [Heptranchias perlo]|uniref:E3 ubiquitin/ISG15 ligase TRIM25-like n=1 Tax=Heptranchias perlo TaxID=212740 RepID=UPI0035595F07